MKNGTLEEDLNIDASLGTGAKRMFVKQVRKEQVGLKVSYSGTGKLKAFSKRKVDLLLSK